MTNPVFCGVNRPMTPAVLITYILIIVGIVAIFLTAGQLMLHRKTLRNYLLALLTFCMALNLFNSAGYYSRIILEYPHFFMVAIPPLYLCMPLFMLFLRFWVNPKAEWRRLDYLHFLPALLVLLSLLPVFWAPRNEKIRLIGERLSAEKLSLADYYFISGLIFNALYMTIFLRKANLVLFRERLRGKLNTFLFFLGQVTLLGTFLLLIAAAVQKSAELDIAGVSGLGIILFLIYTLTLRNPDFIFDLKNLVGSALKYQKSRLKNTDIGALKREFYDLLEREKIFTDPELTLAVFAKRLNVKPHTLSEFLNQSERRKYNDIVNEYRIKEASALLKNEPDAAVYSVGYRVGFSSRSSFNAAFQKITGIAPTDFRRQNSK